MEELDHIICLLPFPLAMLVYYFGPLVVGAALCWIINRWNARVASTIKYAGMGAATLYIAVNFHQFLSPADEFFIFFAWTLIVGLFWYRMAVRLFLHQLWTKWYLRQSINISVIGLFCLFFTCYAGGGAYACWHAHEISSRIPDTIYKTREGKTLMDRLGGLLCLHWLLDNCGSFVILPTGLMLIIGYSIERRKYVPKRSA